MVFMRVPPPAEVIVAVRWLGEFIAQADRQHPHGEGAACRTDGFG